MHEVLRLISRVIWFRRIVGIHHEMTVLIRISDDLGIVIILRLFPSE